LTKGYAIDSTIVLKDLLIFLALLLLSWWTCSEFKPFSPLGQHLIGIDLVTHVDNQIHFSCHIELNSASAFIIGVTAAATYARTSAKVRGKTACLPFG